MADHGSLVQRVRDTLAERPVVREVNMFGGVAFMVNEKLALSAGRDGDLLVRVDPERAEELLTAHGARPAEMGAGRTMGKGWITVGQGAVATDEALDFWIDAAATYNDEVTGSGGRRRRRGKR